MSLPVHVGGIAGGATVAHNAGAGITLHLQAHALVGEIRSATGNAWTRSRRKITPRRMALPLVGIGTVLVISACATGTSVSEPDRAAPAVTATPSNRQDVLDLYAFKRQLAALRRGRQLPGSTPGVAPDYTITVSPTAILVPQGSSAHATVSVGAVRGLANAVALSATGLPQRVSARSVPSTVAPSPTSSVVTSVLTIAAATSAPVGTVTVTVHSAVGAVHHAATLKVTVAGSTWSRPVAIGPPVREAAPAPA